MIDNQFYDSLGSRWYFAKDDPVALLRAESRRRNPWIAERIRDFFPNRKCRILDVACGAGFLSNYLKKSGHNVTGIDLSEESLNTARKHDATRTVEYLRMDAHRLRFSDSTFDVVCSMDFLEHTETPELVVQEISRVLKPGGLFFFHTFNRNFLSWLIVVKGVEWFVKNTPPHMHDYRLFLTPRELREMCNRNGLSSVIVRGLAPKIFQRAFWKLLFRGTVEENFEFQFTQFPLMGYSGCAVSQPNKSSMLRTPAPESEQLTRGAAGKEVVLSPQLVPRIEQIKRPGKEPDRKTARNPELHP